MHFVTICFWLLPKSVTMNDLERQNGPFLRYFAEFGSLRGTVRKSGWQSHNYGQFTITMSSKNVCRGTARRPLYKYSITTRCKFCSRFIHSRLNAQYLPNYRLIILLKEIGSLSLVFWFLKYVCDIVIKKFTFAVSSPDEFLFQSTYNASTVTRERVT